MTECVQTSFIDLCLIGQASVEDIDDFIETWHTGPFAQELHDYLGMTWEEYAAWVANPDLLPLIIKAHEDDRNLADRMEETGRAPHSHGQDTKDQRCLR